ncbi:MAG: hypothetical protein M5U14_10620 [Acidimicrobiia bacterium]|nr:hypothetical protein [Acidimicrobiia bacterium]
MPSERDAEAAIEEDFWGIMRDQLLGFGFLEVLMGQKVYDVPPEMKPMLLRNPGVWAGNPDQVREQAASVLDFDLDLLMVRTMWTNYKLDRALRNLETFAREVMPMLRAEEALR